MIPNNNNMCGSHAVLPVIQIGKIILLACLDCKRITTFCNISRLSQARFFREICCAFYQSTQSLLFSSVLDLNGNSTQVLDATETSLQV
eukprot:g32048.t1